jgi:TetR/AcrR family transcriptional regulator, copper-responsive repressor
MKIEQKRSRGRPRSFDRDSALHTALLLFWQHGYEGASIAQLSAAMAVNAPSLYAAFGSKEQLYREALELYAKQYGALLSQPLMAGGSAREALRQTLVAAARNFSASATPAGCPLASGMLHCASEHQGAAQISAAMRLAAQQAFAQRIEQGIRAGDVSRDCNVTALAGLFAAVIQGLSVQAIDGASQSQLLAVAEAAMQAWPPSHD